MDVERVNIFLLPTVPGALRAAVPIIPWELPAAQIKNVTEVEPALLVIFQLVPFLPQRQLLIPEKALLFPLPGTTTMMFIILLTIREVLFGTTVTNNSV